MATVTEIAPDVYRISIYESQFKLQFNHFLVKDKEPLLFHAGMKGMFPLVREALARIIDPATIRRAMTPQKARRSTDSSWLVTCSTSVPVRSGTRR